MSLLKLVKAQLGLSVTPANNFTLTAEAANGTMKLARGNAGATTQDILTVDASGKVSFPQDTTVISAGFLMNFTGTAAPTGWLACPLVATNISRTTYAALFAAIGTTWGVGDGSTTFGCPWFPADYAELQANGNVGSATTGQILSHTHLSFNTSGGTGQTGVSFGTPGQSAGVTGAAAGSANLAAGHRVLKCVKI